MSRKNIFQLLNENYDIQSEVSKIFNLYSEEDYFKDIYANTYTLEELIDKYLFNGWKLRGTCISTQEFFRRADANIYSQYKNSEESITNFLEVIENFIKLYIDNSQDLHSKEGIKYFEAFVSVFCELIDELEKRMGLSKRSYKDKVLLYPKNAALEHVLDSVEEEDVQWELIRYSREDMSLNEKRKSLAYLATNLYIEKDSDEKNTAIGQIAQKATNILNNLHIRHNNKIGKWENAALNDIDESDAIKLCDYAFSLMLSIVLLREQKQYEEVYTAFNKKQKTHKENGD